MKTALKLVAAGAAVGMLFGAGPVQSNSDGKDGKYDNCWFVAERAGISESRAKHICGKVPSGYKVPYVEMCALASDDAIVLSSEWEDHSIAGVPVPKNLHEGWVMGTCDVVQKDNSD
ncbi:hypothetical protein TVNIR_1912 [Thioalkalivibrio nitratireducens DSM 14787]|uniref:Uncharacterized protein n=1 Tax=Thioalkalivibrio nitratireducens (strain DSM 14787 / UNIQEM 213 / ALEN2) TaxID=1255043 RepID=L0DWZ7_THIND|nr:hypothetical protein [Thioalkalivibrio nitratireducens]AGA33573.2 hypothetical protein TVNIR_1912 [Thioalkalivibrio nitratireducens DSM 14787]